MRTNQDGLGRLVTISDEEIGLLDGDQTLVQQTELNVSERFSALLWMPHCQHKISKVWENGNHVIGGSSTQNMLTNTIEFGKAWLMRSNILTRQVCHNIVIVWDVHCFLDARSAQGLRDPIPYPLDNFDWTGYMPSGPPLSRLVY
uniref:Uncharacterized protein n=1 Tax=Oryza nivara TaxID=4536 RepID=A0A0E0GBB9_ORYNI